LPLIVAWRKEFRHHFGDGPGQELGGRPVSYAIAASGRGPWTRSTLFSASPVDLLCVRHPRKRGQIYVAPY
jgi:hypothetical protein